MLGVVVAENRTPQGRVRTRESPRPAVQNRSSEVDAVSDARPDDLLVCLLDYLLAWLLGGASHHDFDGDALSLRPKRRPTLVLEDEGAPWIDGVSAEDSFVRLARNRARLAAFTIDEANDRPAWSRRPRRPGRAGRPLIALLALGAGDLLVFASRKRQERQQQGHHQQTNWHGRHAPSRCSRISR